MLSFKIFFWRHLALSILCSPITVFNFFLRLRLCFVFILCAIVTFTLSLHLHLTQHTRPHGHCVAHLNLHSKWFLWQPFAAQQLSLIESKVCTLFPISSYRFQWKNARLKFTCIHTLSSSLSQILSSLLQFALQWFNLITQLPVSFQGKTTCLHNWNH